MLTSLPGRYFDSDSSLALAIIVVLLGLGLFLHNAPFTPDEPREFDIAWNMLQQTDKAVPLLAGEPFCEKPPLTYWAAAGSMWLLGPAVWTARLPNVLWTAITLMCLLSWTRSVVPKPLQNRALVFTLLSAGSMFLLLRVQLWLATDAPLVAMTAIALLGQWRGLQAVHARERLFYYTLFHVGLIGAFFAKNLLGWLVPVLALLGFIVWERRWRELLRWELYAGLVLQIALLGAWIWAVAQHSDGMRLLRIFLVDNSLGRFLPIATEEQYQHGHRNHFGKYFLELPYYLLPWTFAALAALRWAYKTLRYRAPAENAIARLQLSAIRFALLTTLPGLVFLSLSKTARDVYLAPELLGFAMLIGLWFGPGLQMSERFDRVCLRLTSIASIGLGMLLLFATLALPTLQSQWSFLPRSLSTLPFASALGILLTVYVVYCWRSQWPNLASVFNAWGIFAVGVVFTSTLLLPSMDESQDLRPAARAIATQYRSKTVGILRADETMRAYLDFGAGIRAANFKSLQSAADWLTADAAHVLVMELQTNHITPAARARLQSWHVNSNEISPPDINKSANELQLMGFRLLSKHETIGGRTYGVIGNAQFKQ